MTGMKTLRGLMGAAMLCAGCSSITPSRYSEQKPELDLRSYLNGRLVAWGMFQDRKGEVVKRFRVDMTCTWTNNVGTLEEDFSYADGSTQRRVWTITRHDATTYTGTAGDVVGTAMGKASGNALNWSYTLALPVEGKVYNVRFDDWMFLMDDEVMLNRAVMSKWGIRLGEVTLAFRKLGE